MKIEMQYNNLLGHNLKALPGREIYTTNIWKQEVWNKKNPSSHNLRPRKEKKIKPKASRRKEIIKVEINQIRWRKQGKKMKQYASSLKRAKKWQSSRKTDRKKTQITTIRNVTG